MIVIDGKQTSQIIRQEIALEVKAWIEKGNRKPHLVAVLVGSDGASLTYVNAKIKACEESGITSSLIVLDANVSEADLLNEIDKLNKDKEIDGFIIQLPLPKHISEKKVIEAIDAEKDVDGFHPINVGRMALNLDCYLPATPFGVITLLERYNIPTIGKHCVVMGRSHIVGSPLSILLARNGTPGNATVTMVHSKTVNLKEITLTADILIVAIGKPEFVTADMVKEGAVVIDVGVHRIPSTETKSGYQLKGDVNYKDVSTKCSAITPVPGGVGPMTIVSLLFNTLKAAKFHARS